MFIKFHQILTKFHEISSNLTKNHDRGRGRGRGWVVKSNPKIDIEELILSKTLYVKTSYDPTRALAWVALDLR